MIRLINLLTIVNIFTEMYGFGQLSIDLDSEDDNTFVQELEFMSRNNTNKLFEKVVIPEDNVIKNKDSKGMNTHCSSFHSCYDCVRSPWYPCGWCHDFGCTYNPYNLCPKTIDASNDRHRGIKSCPYIKHDGDILIPAGVRTNLKVKLNFLDPIIYRKNIVCEIRLKERITRLKGFTVSDFVYCYPFTIDDIGLIKYKGTFKLIWGGANPYSNEIPVLVYKCEKLAQKCSTCTSLPPEYGCGWCEQTQQCVVSDKCEGNIIKLTLNKTSCVVHEVDLIHNVPSRQQQG